MTVAEWHAGDTLPDLTGSTGMDLTGTTVTVHVRTPAGSLISRPAVVAGGTGGAWSLPWQAGDLDVGAYQHEVEVTDAGGKIRTFSGTAFRVKPQLDVGLPPFIPPLTVVDNGDGTTTVTWS